MHTSRFLLVPAVEQEPVSQKNSSGRMKKAVKRRIIVMNDMDNDRHTLTRLEEVRAKPLLRLVASRRRINGDRLPEIFIVARIRGQAELQVQAPPDLIAIDLIGSRDSI